MKRRSVSTVVAGLSALALGGCVDPYMPESAGWHKTTWWWMGFINSRGSSH